MGSPVESFTENPYFIATKQLEIQQVGFVRGHNNLPRGAINMFILPAPGINGHNGWFVHGRRGRAALERPEQFVAYSKAAAFPRGWGAMSLIRQAVRSPNGAYAVNSP